MALALLLALCLFSAGFSESVSNWARNVEFKPKHLHYPKTIHEIQTIVKSAAKVRVLGTGHSFNLLADTSDTMISLRDLNKVISCCEGGVARVEAGINYATLSPILEEKGWALDNLASLPHISVIGAATTATHGSGVNRQSLSSAVKSIKFVDANGDLQTLSTTAPGIGPVLLGAIGVIVELELALVPSFKIQQCVYPDLPFTTLFENPQIFSAAYSVSLFTDWAKDAFTSVWVKKKLTKDEDTEPCPPKFFNAILSPIPVHPIIGLDASSTTTQTQIGTWYEKLPHFRHDKTPSAGEELQAEFFISRTHALDAIKEVRALFAARTDFVELVQTSEIRTLAEDGFWLSPCRADPAGCLAIHVTWMKDPERVPVAVSHIEKILQKYNAKPHWGKLFTLTPERVQALYGDVLPQVREVLNRFDPKGKFRNEYVEKYIFGASGSQNLKREL